jgi:universal stress protein A
MSATPAKQDPEPGVPFRNVLVAVDFSASSPQCLEVATAFARAAGARLVLLHVHEPIVAVDARLRDASPLAIFELSALDVARLPVEAPPLVDSRLDALQRELLERTGVRAETRLRCGSAAAQIVDAAFEEGSDLIVMGTHGRSGLRRWLMGSVAETVVRHARCPVLTLRLPEVASKAQEGAFDQPSPSWNP